MTSTRRLKCGRREGGVAWQPLPDSSKHGPRKGMSCHDSATAR